MTAPTSERRLGNRRVALSMLLCVLVTSSVPAIADDEQSAMASRGRAALRAMDCARCHGRDYNGWSAPSLLGAVRDGSRERFNRFVLEGDIVRGMPGYGSQPRVVADLDAIYIYLQMRVADTPGSPRP